MGMTEIDALRDACAAWQGGRDGGSSPIRAAARVLTGTAHYFTADFITDYERAAAQHPVTMARARVLLEALGCAARHDASTWAQSGGVSSTWVGRGIASGVQDPQIVQTLDTGRIQMPLWGLSLDQDVALSFGSRFLFEVIGIFPAVPAWLSSGIKADERELITGGTYAVEALHEDDSGTTHVRLRFVDAIHPIEA